MTKDATPPSADEAPSAVLPHLSHKHGSLQERLDELLNASFGEFFDSIERQNEFVALLIEFGCPKWVARPGVKILAPLFCEASKRSVKWISASARHRLTTAFLKLPGADRFLDAIDKVRAKLDLKLGASLSLRKLIKEVSPEAEALQHHLTPDLYAHYATLSAVKDLKAAVDEIDAALEIANNPQPSLRLWVSAVRDESRFVYRSRAIPFVGREDAINQLNSFLEDNRRFAWHMLLGQGGTGKSRLALEFLISHASGFSSAAGFISADALTSFDWERWRPITPTLIVVDYASREADAVARMIGALSVRDDLECAVRVLLIERSIDGAWFDTIRHRGRAERFPVEECWFSRDGSLEPPDDVWPIIQHMVEGYDAPLPDREQCLDVLNSIDPHMRPLYAAFLGDALGRGEKPRGWDREALVSNVLDHEQRNYWTQAGITHHHHLIFANATVVGGVPIEWAKQMAPEGMSDPDDWVAENLKPAQLNLVFDTIVFNDIPPLEPDILGEVFVIEAWRKFTRTQRERFLNFAVSFGPWTADFLDRMASDFPESSPQDMLWAILNADFEDNERAHAEMAYNVCRALTPVDYAFAKKVFESYSDRIQPLKSDEYFIDCLTDMAFNLVAGMPRETAHEALKVYHKHRTFVGEPEFDSVRLTLCETAVNIIGRWRQSDHKEPKALLDDVLALSEKKKEELDFVRERVSAYANFIWLMVESDLDEALRNYVVMKEEALAFLDDQGVLMAWCLAAYHVYLLKIAVEGDESADAFKFGLMSESEDVWRYVDKEYKQDLANLDEGKEG